MIAAFDGTCCLCLASITANVDEILPVDGDWAHKECAEDEGYGEE